MMFIKHNGKIYKEVELEELTKEELLEIMKGVKEVPKEITIREENPLRKLIDDKPFTYPRPNVGTPYNPTIPMTLCLG